MRCLASVLTVFALATPILAQDSQGWSFSGLFQGSANDSGFVTKADPSLGYQWSRHVRTYAGLPFYIVKQSSLVTPTTTTGTVGLMSGIGNAYLGIEFISNNDEVNFTSTIEGTAPTGDEAKGFSTGRATVDWTNTFSHTFTSISPFASAGLANTVSDTSFFVRPFTTTGFVTHFDGGAKFALSPIAEVGALAYGVNASGQQRLVSKVLNRNAATTTTQVSGKNRFFDTTGQILGNAQLADDYGFSAWVSVHAGSKTDLQLGYTRSGNYDLNMLFFGIGHHFGNEERR
jgi:hypothetical protein